jgi:oligopeptide/dipeptide ABC transporter ATP-binding protein
MGCMSQILVDKHDSILREPILRVKDLSVTYRKVGSSFGSKSVEAVRGVSFELRESEIFSIVGESGSGKTSLGKTIGHLVPASKGSILYKGKDTSALHGEELRKYRTDVQMVFQDPFESLNPRYSVFTTISEPLRNLLRITGTNTLTQRTSKLLEEVGLDPSRVMRRYPHQLSGGERQRVNIARAMASEPKILIADEPITMLDAEQRLSILSLLIDLKSKRGLSVIFITHDLASANLISDRIMVMYLGKIMERGQTELVLTHPCHPYSEEILSAMPPIQFDDRPKNSRAIIAGYDGKGCVFRTRCRYANEKCLELEPELRNLSISHEVACHWPISPS